MCQPRFCQGSEYCRLPILLITKKRPNHLSSWVFCAASQREMGIHPMTSCVGVEAMRSVSGALSGGGALSAPEAVPLCCPHPRCQEKGAP